MLGTIVLALTFILRLSSYSMSSIALALSVFLSFHLTQNHASATPIHLQARQSQTCTNGGTWTRIVESFDGLNQTLWTLDASGVSFGRQGAVMTVNQAQVGCVFSCHRLLLTVARQLAVYGPAITCQVSCDFYCYSSWPEPILQVVCAAFC